MKKISNGKRLAKNTLMLYVRMFLMMGISLYTSRVVLMQLGVTDFGIYNVVGGAVALLGFLNTSMSGATSRFLTYDIGRGDYAHLKEVFSSAMQIHLVIALIVVLVGEIVGVWFINTCLEIPLDRRFAANIVYQFSVFSAAIGIVQVPYSATLIAFERIDVYSWIEILNSFLKLGIVYVLSYSTFDKLETYSCLMFMISIVVCIIYIISCKKRFDIGGLKWKFHKNIIYPMLSFTGWDLYGNGCVVLRQQGTNILLNQFFGVLVNAAGGVANQVSAAVSIFASNVTMAVRPQIIKQYAAGNIGKMQNLMSFTIISSLLLIQVVMIPIYLNIEFVMKLWLEKVPPYATDFCKLLMIANSVNVFVTIWNIAIHASGKIKLVSFLNGSLFLISLPVVYVVLKIDANPNLAYILWICVIFFVLCLSVFIAKCNIKELSLRKIFIDCFQPIVSVGATIFVMSYLSDFWVNGIVRLLSVTVLNFLILLTLIYVIWIVPNFKGSLKKAYKYYLL